MTKEQQTLFKTNISTAKSFNKIELDCEEIEDHVIYKVGEFCYSKTKELFVQTNKLIKIGDEVYAEITGFNAIKDKETGLWYGNDVGTIEDPVLLSSLTRPMIVAMENNNIWFVGHQQSEEFHWMKAHIKL